MGNRLVVDPDSGKLLVPPYECQFNLAEFISNDTWNRLRLKVEAGGDGKMLVLSEEQVSSIANNRLKVYMGGDHKFYVLSADLISTDARPGLELGTDQNLKAKPGDLISTGNDGGLTTDSDGKIAVDWEVFFRMLFSPSRFRVVNSNVLPAGGTWAYILFALDQDSDIGGDDHYMKHILAAGTDAGGAVIGGTTCVFTPDVGGCQMVVWRVA